MNHCQQNEFHPHHSPWTVRDGPRQQILSERAQFARASLIRQALNIMFGSPRIQAGILGSRRCPPEGGRYMNKDRVFTHVLMAMQVAFDRIPGLPFGTGYGFPIVPIRAYHWSRRRLTPILCASKSELVPVHRITPPKRSVSINENSKQRFARRGRNTRDWTSFFVCSR